MVDHLCDRYIHAAGELLGTNQGNKGGNGQGSGANGSATGCGGGGGAEKEQDTVDQVFKVV